jgi:hypothetical protein
LSKIQELASLKQPGFFNDKKFDFLNGNSLMREEEFFLPDHSVSQNFDSCFYMSFFDEKNQ